MFRGLGSRVWVLGVWGLCYEGFGVLGYWGEGFIRGLGFGV